MGTSARTVARFLARKCLPLAAAVFLYVALVPSDGRADPPAAPATADASRVEEARKHFNLGVSHIDRQEWEAALAEFLESRALVATKTNTKNAAICLRKVGRFDESLALFAVVLRDFPDLSPAERASIEHEIADLEGSIGTIEIADAPSGAAVSVDGIDRGTTPLAGPIRLAAGGHVVRVVKDGSLPLEAHVDLAGKQAFVLHSRLAPLTQAGRLRVTEHDGQSLHVVVDGAPVGSTPWEGALTPGTHTVWARGEGTLGTPPTPIAVDLDHAATLELHAAELPSALRIEAHPSQAEISIDAVPVGRGSWEGRLLAGLHHVEAALPGYARFARDMTLGEGTNETVNATLEPIAESRSNVSAELTAGLPIGLLWGGDIVGSCNGACSTSLPIGWQALLRLTYWLSPDVGLGLHAGYLRLYETVTGRPETLSPVGKAPHAGFVKDVLRMGGVMIGGDAMYVRGKDWPLTLRLAFGVLVGTVTDHRSGTFTDSTGSSYPLDWTQSINADYFYAAPELRVGHLVTDSLELNAGITVLVMAALAQPRWDSSVAVPAGQDGQGSFANASLSGELMIAAVPEVGLRYMF